MVGLQKKKISVAVIFVLSVAMLLGSCKEPIGGTGKAPVFLVVENPQPYLVSCDVYKPAVTGHVSDDTKTVTIKSVLKSTTIPVNTFSDVIIQEYRVNYFRSDGNPNVPEPFFELGNHTVPVGGAASLEILIVRAEAKLKAPLVSLAFGGGEGSIMMNAVVEFFGEDLSGNAVSGSVVIPITAKDFPG